jgi:hypothetical protein
MALAARFKTLRVRGIKAEIQRLKAWLKSYKKRDEL